MKAILKTAFILLLLHYVTADEIEVFDDGDISADPRLFFVNFTSSLVQVNATILAYGLIFLAILGAAAIALYYLYLESQNNTGYGYGYSSGGSGYSGYQARSNDANGFDSLNIIQWIGTLQDMYENFDYNDMECQKRQICEFVKEPELFGATAKKFKNGLQYAKYFEKFMPGEMQFILDEYMQANDKGLDNKDCEEFFPCEFSLKNSYRKTFTGNGL